MQAGTVPSSSAAVTSAMGQLPPQTQRGIAEFRANDPQKLRDLMAHNLHSPSLTGSQQEALWTIGTARNRTERRQGIASAMGVLDRQAAAGANQTGAGTGTAGAQRSSPAGGPQPGGGGGASPQPAAAGGGARSSAASQSAASQPPTPPATGPPPAGSDRGAQSLGPDLPQQPPSPGSGSREGPGSDGGLTDVEPFLD